MEIHVLYSINTMIIVEQIAKTKRKIITQSILYTRLEFHLKLDNILGAHSIRSTCSQ